MGQMCCGQTLGRRVFVLVCVWKGKTSSSTVSLCHVTLTQLFSVEVTPPIKNMFSLFSRFVRKWTGERNNFNCQQRPWAFKQHKIESPTWSLPHLTFFRSKTFWSIKKWLLLVARPVRQWNIQWGRDQNGEHFLIGMANMLHIRQVLIVYLKSRKSG